MMSAVHVCHHWMASDRRDVYVFGKEGAETKAIVEKMRARVGVKEVRVVDARVNDDDTVDVLRAKFLHHALGATKAPKTNLYAWYRQTMAAHEMNDLVDEVFDKRAAIRAGELQSALRVHFPRVRGNAFGDPDSLYDRAGALEAICEKGLEHRVVPLEFDFLSAESARAARIPGLPFDTRRMGVDAARRVRTEGRILSALGCEDREYHFVTDKDLDNPVYFDPSPPPLPDYRKIRSADETLEAIEECVRDNVVETKGLIQRLTLRVFPRDTIRIDFGRVLYGFELSEEVPMILYMSTNARVYRTRKETLRTMPPRLVTYVESFENERRDRVCKHKTESMVFFCVYEGSVFRLVISENGSYRLFYRFARGTAPAYAVVKKSFRIVQRIVEYIDRGRGGVFVVSPNAKVFDSDKVEVVEQVIAHTVVLSTRLVSTAVFQRNIGELGSLFGESDNGLIKYKRVDRFRDVSAVMNFVHTHIQIERDELVQRVAKEFDMSGEEAARAVDNHMRDERAPGVAKHGGRVFAERRYHPGVSLVVRVPNDHTLVVRSAQSAHPRYAENAVNAVIYAASRKKVKRSAEAKAEKQAEAKEEKQADDDVELQYGDLLNNTSVDEFINSDGFDLDMYDLGIDLNVEVDADEGAKDADEDDESMSESKRYTTFVLNKLIEADRELFTWEDKKYRNYAAKCGAVDFRQPVVINAKEKAKIDADHPGSYTGYVQTGSTPELAKKNYYICPKLWCKLGRYSITEEEFERNGKKCGAPFFEKPLRFPPEGKPNYFMTSKGTEARLPHFLKKSMHPKNMQLPCCAKRSKDAIMTTSEGKTEDVRARYVASVDIDYPLHPDRIGQITEGLAKALGSVSYTGPLAKETRCVVRVGADNLNGHGLARCAETILDVADVCRAAAERMEVWHFIALNGGNTLRTFSHPDDGGRVSDAKAMGDLRRFLTANEKYVRMFGLERVVRDVGGESGREMYDDVIREMMIWTSFQRYKAYLLDDDFAKSEDDMYHLLHLEFVNKNNYGFIIVRQRDDRVTQVINPKYFELMEVLHNRDRFAILVRVRPGVYEYLARVEGRESRDALFDEDDVERLLRRMRRLPRVKMGGAETCVVGYDMKWRGVMDTTGKVRPVHPPRPLPLSHGRYRYEEGDVDARIFTRSPEADSYTPSGIGIYRLASEMMASKTLRDEYALLRHELNPLSMRDRATLMRKSYVAVKAPGEKIPPIDAFEKMFVAPLEYYVSEYESRTQRPSVKDVYITHEQVVRGILSAQYERAHNTYRFWDSSSDDRVKFVDVLFEEPVEETTNVRWIDSYVPLRPVRVATMFPTFEMHDAEMDLSDLVRLCEGSFDEFVRAYVSEMRALFNTDWRKFMRRLNQNPNVREHPTIERAWAIDGFEEMIRRDTYKPSVEDVAFVAQHYDQTIVLLSRALPGGTDGVMRVGPPPQEDMYVLHHQRETAPVRIAFRLVVERRRRSTVRLMSIPEETRKKL